MRNLLLIGLGLLVFAGVSYFRYENIHMSSRRLAEASRDLCYASRGIDLNTASDVSEADREECTRPMAVYAEGENGRYLSAGLQGLVAALIVVGLALLLLRRRGQAAA
jgi:hypothetical protein